jgi:hypothetical protein
MRYLRSFKSIVGAWSLCWCSEPSPRDARDIPWTEEVRVKAVNTSEQNFKPWHCVLLHATRTGPRGGKPCGDVSDPSPVHSKNSLISKE